MVRFLRGSNFRNDNLKASDKSEQWVIEGFGGNDTLTGGYLRDTLDGGSGVDVMEGGEGNDRYRVDNSNDVIIEKRNRFAYRGGNDLVTTTVNYTLPAHVERLDISEDTRQRVVFGAGNELDNELFGSDTAEKDILDGRDGDDMLFGFGNNDALFGGRGVDQLDGGDGNDTLQGAYSFNRSPNDVDFDFLTGGRGSDTFVLGNGGRKFYMGEGISDSANITDFSQAEGDKLQLNGDRNDYVIGSGNSGDSFLYVDVDSNGIVNGVDDIIAGFSNISPFELSNILNNPSSSTFL